MAQTAQITVFPTEPQNEAQRVLQVQRNAYLDNPYPSREERLENLKKLEDILVDNQDAIAEAIRKDFGNRAVEESKLLELFLSIDGFRYCRKHLKKWMKPQRRGVSIWFAGASNRVLAQPKGVVGVVEPRAGVRSRCSKKCRRRSVDCSRCQAGSGWRRVRPIARSASTAF